MDSGLDAANPALVAAFRSALLRQSVVVIAIFALLLLAYWVVRGRQFVWLALSPGPAAAASEPTARRVLRTGFGLLWIVDGILQAQPKMAGGLTSQVIAPAAVASPRWVQDVVNAGGTVWSYHPVQAAAAAVWIQIGLGLWLIVTPAGWWSRLAGLASVAWGLVVWVFGESFGGIFAPGLTWLTGAPGAVLLYVVAGTLIALPLTASDSRFSWTGPWLGRMLLTGIGLFWVGMAVLQAWPGRGYWQGGDSGTLTGMVQSMAQTDQPHAQAAMISAFASLTRADGFAVNLVVVIVLAALGLALISGRRALLRIAVPAAVVFCLADWVLVQDFGIPGGLGTDPNSMVPWILLLWAGYRALSVPEAAGAEAARRTSPSPRLHLRPADFRHALFVWLALFHGPAAALGVTRPASVSARSVISLGAAGVVLVGAAPMAAAAADNNADPVIARAVAGASVPVDRPAPSFQLLSESGQPVGLTSLRGKAVLLTFLDPVCVGCPEIGRELRGAATLLGSATAQIELVAIAASASHSDASFLRAFEQKEGLAALPDWLFLTGTAAQLQQAWDQYEAVAPHMMSGMSPHSDIVFVIDPAGRIRQEVKDGPGPGTASARSSFAVLLSDAAKQSLQGS